jgi:hypothetical protein
MLTEPSVILETSAFKVLLQNQKTFSWQSLTAIIQKDHI